jgi:hypothetical protein
MLVTPLSVTLTRGPVTVKLNDAVVSSSVEEVMLTLLMNASAVKD